jgi:hypothetical protein
MLITGVFVVVRLIVVIAPAHAVSIRVNVDHPVGVSRMIPCSIAQTESSVRLPQSALPRMLRMWALTVRGLT